MTIKNVTIYNFLIFFYICMKHLVFSCDNIYRMNDLSLSRDSIEDFQCKTKECPEFLKKIIAETLICKWTRTNGSEIEYRTSAYRNEKYSGFSLQEKWPEESSSIEILCKNKRYMIGRDVRKEKSILHLYDKQNQVITNFKGITSSILAIVSAYKDKDFFYIITSDSTKNLPPHKLIRFNIITYESQVITHFPVDTYWGNNFIDWGDYFIALMYGNLYAYDKKKQSAETLLCSHVYDIIGNPTKTFLALLMSGSTKECCTIRIIPRENNLIHALTHSIVLQRPQFNSPVLEFIGRNEEQEIITILESCSDMLSFFAAETGKLIASFKLPFYSSHLYRDKENLYLQKVPGTVCHSENQRCVAFLISYPLWFIRGLIEYMQR